MNILVLNCGSSSLKFQVINVTQETIDQNAEDLLAKGVIERIGSQSLITLKPTGRKTQKKALPFRNHAQAIDFVLKWLVSEDSDVTAISKLSDIQSVGHRVVHGGEKFSKSVLINDEVIEGIEDCIDLAPLHNPANLDGIAAIEQILGKGVPQAAVFDTAFHSEMPQDSYLYPIPYQFYRRYKIRRYGFHGTSHRYISYRYRFLTNTPKSETNIITLHLGNGCSACAIREGKSADTSMGMTPLEGLTMGTRTGDIDPAILEYLHLKEGITYSHLFNMLNKQSGLLGISGLTNDMRELLEEEEENQDRRASLAIDIFCRRVRKYIGAYLANMNGADAIIFSGGIGENSATIRSRICQNLSWFGVAIDEERNQSMSGGNEGIISTSDSKVKLVVIPTNEELLIARDTYRCVEGII
ncbi:acetate kinase [Pseudobacteriovorax antillogorgiicola]|uniref:Acetate kinase n=1 Tax=Pseudobacteriovorax antillogorgiicola TaxID=1513793 RepID=A0A1Y6CCB9_9BACT|nr:acetate kinase [Pseudobacteriovorax antillogorgiicola]TCS49371.1 acetate kinase [Pseudobacteriovorax antillogorgiicola]SMF47421.1 acetate kinase [Pseudobacteriovorax antillogorgiicola]